LEEALMNKEKIALVKKAALIIAFILLSIFIFFLISNLLLDIYDKFDIIKNTRTDHSDEEDLLSLLSYLNIILPFFITTFFIRWIYKKTLREKLNIEEKLIYKWILLGSIFSLIPIGVVQQFLIKEYSYELPRVINFVTLLFSLGMGVISWRWYRINLSISNGFNIWKVKIIFKSRENLFTYNIYGESPTEKNAMEISKQHITRYNNNVKLLCCDAENITRKIWFLYPTIVPSSSDGVLKVEIIEDYEIK